MRALNLITEEIPPLTHSDTGEKALNWMDEFKVSHLPVLKFGVFVGLVSEADILDKMNIDQPLDELFQHLMLMIANTGGIKENGGIVVLEMAASNYSMAEIGQIVESNDAKILSSYIMSSDNSTTIEVTLKINNIELDRVIRTFERYDYIIKASYQKGEFEEDMQFRYDALMNYLKL